MLMSVTIGSAIPLDIQSSCRVWIQRWSVVFQECQKKTIMYVFLVPENNFAESKRNCLLIHYYDHCVHNIRLKCVYCMIRNVIFFLLLFYHRTCLNKVIPYCPFFFPFPWIWFCSLDHALFSMALCFYLLRRDITECFKLLNTREGRGLVSWTPRARGSENQFKSSPEAVYGETNHCLNSLWLAHCEVFFHVWLVTMKYTLEWKIFNSYFCFPFLLHAQLSNIHCKWSWCQEDNINYILSL